MLAGPGQGIELQLGVLIGLGDPGVPHRMTHRAWTISETVSPDGSETMISRTSYEMKMTVA